MFKHARRLFLSLGLAAATAFTTVAPPAQAQVPYFRNLLAATQTKYAAVVVDAKSGEVMYAKHADSPRYPASITKVMTLYLTFEALASGRLKMDDQIRISPHAAAQPPSKLGLRPGDSLSVDDAMKALATRSANDISVALAERIGGTESRFAALMTLRAQELGMQNTHFANASGLPDSRQLTTARDIAILSRAVMRDYPQYYKLFSLQSFQFRGQTIGNHNRMLARTPGVDGLKTGFTNASGFNIAISAVRNSRRLIVVVMGGPTTAARDQNAEDLLLTGFDVIRRRGMGEKLTIAQNLFEPDLTGPVQRAGVEQGDSDQNGLQIELASAPPPRPQARLEVEPRSPRLSSKSSWGVQVGAFSSRADAREQLAIVRKRFGKAVDGASGAAEKDGGKYKARFNGMTEAEARDTCRAMKARKMPCMVLPG